MEDRSEASLADQAMADAPGKPPSTVVGVGASAGGLSALRRLFAAMPGDTGFAFVVVVHLAPDHESRLAEVLQPAVSMPVLQVTETVPLEADTVYVIPPNRNLSTIDTHLRLTPLEPNRRERAPIDHFLRTLAATHDGDSIAMILSGTGADGALGVQAVKEQGGLTIAQSPEEAEHSGMPQSAIATGMVDLVLPIAEMPAAMIRFTSTVPHLVVPPDGAEPVADESAQLQKIITQIRLRTGRDFTRYKPSTVMRRIRRRMQLRSVEELDAYVDRLRNDGDEVRALADELLITVSSFFRDPPVFERLAQVVIPRIFDGKGPSDDVRVWSVGCATGEEAYSLAILLLEEAARRDEPPRLQVFASDLHEHSLARAREGFYPGDIETTMSAQRIERFFRAETGGYRIRDEVRNHVVFAPHDLLGDPPFSRVDLVACRNVMIYLQRSVHSDVIQLFHYALRPDGWLVLGSSETLDGLHLFRAEDKKLCIFRRRNVPVPEPRLPVFPMTRTRSVADSERANRRAEPASYRDLHQRLIEQHAAPSVLVAPDDKVVHVSDRAGRYLFVPAGDLTSNLFKLVRSELVIELRAGLHSARQHGTPWRSPPIAIERDGEISWVAAEVLPSPAGDEEGFALVFFDELTEGDRLGTAPSAVMEAEGAEPVGLLQRVQEARQDRDAARRRLQAIIEEYESSQEELRASNEELQSANEELRSTLEELETSKEELQSMNEELQTVNQENRHKVEELAQLSSDLQNLLTATDIATLFLDRDLRIMRFTPGVAALFNVRATDRGRPISDLTHRLGYDDLIDDATAVLRRLAPVEREVRDDAGRWYLTRVLAYRSTEERIEGVVITFVDITKQKEAEAAIRRSERSTRDIAEAVPSVLFSTDAAGEVTFVSRQIETLVGVTAETVLGTAMWPALIHDEDRAQAEQSWRSARQSGERFEARYRIVHTDGHAFWVIARAVPVSGGGAIEKWYGAITDVDALATAEHQLLEAKESLERRVEERTAQVRELAATLSLAEHEERRRIIQVLHDDLQQQLYSVQFKLAFAKGEASAGRSEAAAQHLDDADAGLLAAIETARSLAVDLSPPFGVRDNLSDALGWLANQMSELHGLQVTIDETDPPVSVPEAVGALLYQAARELLFNVAKHALTDQATVSVRRDDQHVVLRVSDAGRGIEPQTALLSERPGGSGLRRIRERVRLVGGSLDVETPSSGGTAVSVRLPINHRNPQR